MSDYSVGDPRRKVRGLAHILAAGRYSMGGLRVMLHEQAFQHELVAFALGFGLLVLLPAPLVYLITALLLFLILLAVETLNTAIECIVDRVSPEISDMARQAKDMGSFAVFCMLCANGGFFVYALLSITLF